MMCSTATNTTFQKLTASVRRLQMHFQQTTRFWQRYTTVQSFQGKPSSDRGMLPAAMYTVAHSMLITSIRLLQYLHIAGFIIAVRIPFHPNAVQYTEQQHRCSSWLLFPTNMPISNFTACFILHLTSVKFTTTSMQHSPSWQASSPSVRQEISHMLWNMKVHCHIHNSPLLVFILSQNDPIHTIPSCLRSIQHCPLNCA